MTEKEARDWLFDSMISDVSREDTKNFLKTGHERGYIKRSALDHARCEVEAFQKSENVYLEPTKKRVLKIADLFEQAVKEAEGE